MPIPSAERHFKKGLAALADGQPLEAVDCFLEAMQTEQRKRVRHPDMRYLSYYGLSLARAHRVTHAALEACSLAVRHEPESPVLLLNLGRVYLESGRKSSALDCFERGLRLAPNHRALKRERSRVERRAQPCLPFLDRQHPMNRRLGRVRESLRARWTGSSVALEPESP